MAAEEQNAMLRTIVDGNQDVFRYGLYKYDESEFEDPTYLGFTIEIDENSALFTEVLPFLEKQGTIRSAMESRIPVYKEFVAKFKQIFNSQESVKDETDKSVFIKQHYINAITGFDTLHKKFNTWKEDKLTIELYEDISMFSTYLSQLYNNLTYSYENGRRMIPENLLKFNMYIKISEIRNLTSISRLRSKSQSDLQIVAGLKNNVTCLVYKLYDCELNFFNSKPIDDQIVQAGIDAAIPSFSILNFDIFFKSVTRQIYNPLIKNALTLNDNKVDLDVFLINTTGNASTTGQINNASGTSIGIDNQPFQSQSTQSVSVYKQEAFINQSDKKESFIPSEINPDDLEHETYVKDGVVYKRKTDNFLNNLKKTNSQTEENNISQNSGLVTKQSLIKEIMEYNAELAPEEDISIDIPGSKEEIAAIVNDPNQSLSSLTKKIKAQSNNKILQKIKSVKDTIELRRRSLINAFVDDVIKKTPVKKVLNSNVYTDTDLQAQLNALNDVVGKSIAEGVLDLIKNNISVDKNP